MSKWTHFDTRAAWPPGHEQIRVLGWVAFFALMLGGGYAGSYLAGWNIAVLAAGAALAALLLIAGLFLETRLPLRGSGPGPWIETLCHFLPAILFVAIGPTSPSVSTMRHAAFMAYTQHAQGDLPAAQPDAKGYLSVSILDLHVGKDRYNNEAIEVLGRVHVLTDKDQETLPEAAKPMQIRATLYRYAITCCVADAIPLSAILEGVDVRTLKDDAWYKVRGRARFVEQGVDVPLIHVDSLELIPEPAGPYLNATESLFAG